MSIEYINKCSKFGVIMNKLNLCSYLATQNEIFCNFKFVSHHKKNNKSKFGLHGMYHLIVNN